MLNPFFLQGSKGEQNLVQDLINEQIKMYGIDVHYIPRRFVTKKTVIEEVIQSEFNNAFPIEAYVSSYDGYGGQGTLLSKFGIQDVDELILVISKERFETYIAPLIKNLSNIELPTRPKEGDLIYFPLGDRIFEIKYVEHESPFYQLQKNYVYELKCELFRYEDEDFDTDIDQIDDNIVDQGYTKTFTMVGSGSTATAVTSVVNGAVSYISITNRGRGYTSTPTVAISSSPSPGGTAAGIATLITGIVDLCDPTGTGYRVQGVQLTNPGYGYTIAPKVAFYGGGGEGAEAVSYISDGSIGIVTVTNGGSGYITAPQVSVVGSSSTSAEVYSSITNGIVTSVTIVNSGAGYTESPTLIFSNPYMVGFGTYKYNETVIGSSSSTTAKVNSWNANTNILKLMNISGDFENDELVVGQESQAVYKIRIIEEFDITDPYSSNNEIEEESDEIIDFSEVNPFGMP